ncbi:MAG: hypothetical protein HFE64_09830 [Lachnospiraceae bacterium]|jgi:hypothetical protein|nr:hypothetical protein [Lachnospiraceae bacterium]
MKAFSVPEIKPFMAGLLQGPLFYGWQLRSAELGLISRIQIDGNLNADYWTEEEKQKHPSPYLLWDEIQPKIRALIQGGHTPSYMNITLAISPARVPDIARDFIEAFLLNIRFDTATHPELTAAPNKAQSSGTLMLVTGLAAKSFTMDKTPERLWDEKIPTYFKAHGVMLL